MGTCVVVNMTRRYVNARSCDIALSLWPVHSTSALHITSWFRAQPGLNSRALHAPESFILFMHRCVCGCCTMAHGPVTEVCGARVFVKSMESRRRPRIWERLRMICGVVNVCDWKQFVRDKASTSRSSSKGAGGS